MRGFAGAGAGAVVAWLWSLAMGGAAHAANAPAVGPVALYVSGCANVSEPGVRRMVAVELGGRLIAAGDAAPPNVDRVVISCRGAVARLEAGNPGGPRYAERTLTLAQFAGDAGTRAVALAALELLAALDRPPAAPAAPTAPSVPVATSTSATVEIYQRQFVWFNDTIIIGWSGRKFVPYRGKYHEPLSGSDFYQAIERPDLAARYRAWRAVQIALIVLGAGSALYGIANIHTHPSLGMELWLGGGVAIAVGIFSTADPVDESSARQLADEHNKRLKRQLGLAQRENDPPLPTPGGWRLAGAVVPGGATLAARLEF